MSKCIVANCQLEANYNDSKCILHCEKKSYSEDFQQASLLPSFFSALVDNIVEQTFKYEKEEGLNRKEFLKSYLVSNINTFDIDKLTKSRAYSFSSICFSGRDAKDKFDYLQVLNKLGQIQFNKCKFSDIGLDIKGAKCFFQECEFLENWLIYDLQMLPSNKNTLYQHCTFKKDVDTCSETENRCTITSPLFYYCTFSGNVNFEAVDFKEPLFSDEQPKGNMINQLDISNCVFEKRFVLSNHVIKTLSMSNSLFKSKFEFKNNTVEECLVVNTNFSGIADLFKTRFARFAMERNIFEEFVGFENCEFGIKQDSSFENIAFFKYVTFLSFVNFRNTSFYGGLDIEYINLKEAPNFLNAQVPLKNTNRETFRIIKHSFDKIGNSIEANRFFVWEMKKYKEGLASSKMTQEKIIFILNECISDFGQSYLRPIIWLTVVGVIYSLLVAGYKHDMLYHVYVPANNVISVVSNAVNDFAANILPFSKFLKSGMEFISLLFYTIFATLIWQTVIAVKRHVKR